MGPDTRMQPLRGKIGKRPTCHWVNLWVGSERMLHAPFKRYPAKSVHNAIAQHLELQAITAGEASDAAPCQTVTETALMLVRPELH